ncbi:MAG: sigma-70 family RNA polymerase sigma factor, partial [Planctomycetes bacterium]|nr:sigma-70 family RNA polymerase sigma factor [Planctomycetota bacterium]
MPDESTWWTMVRGAAAGDAAARAAFAERYLPAVRAYLSARWRTGPLAAEVEDATQEVFLECFRDGGALARVDPARAGGFRGYLYGIARNVARRAEDRRGRPVEQQLPAEEIDSGDSSLSRAFDRAWANGVMREAAARQTARAAKEGEAALRRVDLLRLRFHDGLPIRDIAARWSADPAWVHHEYARARAEFRAALLDVVAEQHPGSPADIERECAALLDLL